MISTGTRKTIDQRSRPESNPRTVELLRLAASGGRSDRLRVILTAIGAAIATIILLSAAAVAFITDGDGPYELDVLDQPGLRPGVMIAMLMLCVPVVVFVGLCTRVGAPSRDRRLAMLRMAGATPADTTRIAALETGLAALAGSLLGAAVFYFGLPLLDSTRTGEFTTTRADGVSQVQDGLGRLLPTDVSIPVAAVIALISAITIGSTLASIFALRKVRISPFGVTRSTPPKPPTKTAASMFVIGAGGLVVLGATARTREGPIVPVALAALALFIVCVSGLMAGSASISSAVGRFLAPRASRPDLLIASRRMIAAPYTASRATSSVLLAVMIAAAIQGVRVIFLAGQDPADTFYADTFRLLDWVLVTAIALGAANLLVTSTEAIVERRRTLAALQASGTPKTVLARAVLMETLVPLVPSVVLAAGAGTFAARAFFGTSVERLEVFELNGPDDSIRINVPIPWEQLAVLCGGTITISVATTALSLVLLTTSTRPSELRAAA